MPTTDIFDHEIYYEQAGEEGIPIVMLHGVPTSHVQWRPVQHLLEPYMQTYAIDLVRMGRSGKPLDAWDYTFENDAWILEALMDEWGYDEMVVGGDDWAAALP